MSKQLDKGQFIHGEEGTHSVCNKHLRELGGKATCCICDKKTDCDDQLKDNRIIGKVIDKYKEFRKPYISLDDGSLDEDDLHDVIFDFVTNFTSSEMMDFLEALLLN